jgi:hypothetical protein
VATAALRVPLALPACPGCAGGGEVNGLTCRECGGSTRAGGRRRRAWRSLARGPLLWAAGVAGAVVGWSRTLPGIAGAGGVTAGTAVIVHSAWHWVPAYAVAALVAGAFGLMMDRRL